MKLHGYFRSSTSYRLRIALGLKKLSYDYIAVNLKDGAQKEAPFAELNPYKTVPVLETEQGVLAQSLAILDWLEAHYRTPSFLPEDEQSQIVCRELYYAIATEIHAPNNLPVLTYLKKEFGADQAAIEKWIATWVHRTFEPVEARLSQITWLSADLPFGHPTLFEIVLIPQIYNAERWNTDLSPYPNLNRIAEHCDTLEPFRVAHPSVQPDAPEMTS